MTLKASVFAVAVGIAAVCSLPAQAQTSGDMATRVKAALHSDPGVYDKNIDVSVQDGKVVMDGFVRSAEDMQKAIRAANKTAGEKNVVNKLKIKEGGDGGSG